MNSTIASYSTIPHVRSDIQDYLSEGENNIARFKIDYIWSPRERPVRKT